MAVGARPRPGRAWAPDVRLRVPESDVVANGDGVRERGGAAGPRPDPGPRTPQTRGRDARLGRPCRPGSPSTRPAVWWPAAASWYRPGIGPPPGVGVSGRADRQSR